LPKRGMQQYWQGSSRKNGYGLGRGKGRNNILVPNMHKLTECN